MDKLENEETKILDEAMAMLETIELPKIIEYDILDASLSSVLIQAVNKRLKDGWDMYEGLVINPSRLYQIMVKYADE